MEIASDNASNPFTIIASFAVLATLYFAARVIHRLYFHPLHRIPGPKINAISRIPYARHLIAGTTAENVQALHEKYGEVVRISPNEISFISGESAWQDIYGFRTGKHKGQLNMRKDPGWYAPPPLGPHLVASNDEDHSRFRKVLSHSFSEGSLARQEPLLQGYVDLLIKQLKEVTSKDKSAQDMTKWYNWTTFDVIADLLFGEPFGCLQSLVTHDYIEMLFDGLRSIRLAYLMYYWPFLSRLRNLIVDKGLIQRRADYYNWVDEQTKKRVQRDTQRPDFMTEVLKHNGEKGVELNSKELSSNAGVMIIAGSETTATLLSGATYLVLKTPEVLQKLKDEVRGKWKKYDDITIEQVNNTPYLVAVLQEALRFFPPVPAGFGRYVEKGGAFVSGWYVPEGTTLAVSQYAVAHSQRNFKDPDMFVPERWMGDLRYADDNRAAVQPFSFGPRNCIGKNLAYAEMRLIFAKIIWTFDIELDAKSKDWMKECKVMTLWDKPELAVHLKEVVRVE